MVEVRGEWAGGTWSYDKRRRLGRPGGFGDVFAGQGEEGTPVAVKVIRGPGAGGQAPLKLRMRELNIAHKLRDVSSPHLMPILDIGSYQGNLIVILPRAQGTLRDHVIDVDRHQPLDEALEITEQLATGLAHLHEAGVLHRDLKPENVLTWNGTWRLTDYGMGRDMDLSRGTQTFAVGLGTPHYMAPEVWRGDEPSPQTDLYSLGCVMYELLEGSPPFASIDDQQRLKHHHLKHRPDDVPGLPKDVDRLLGNLLRKDPNKRPSSARAVVEALSGGRPQRLF